jgi:acetylornithine deacetylase
MPTPDATGLLGRLIGHRTIAGGDNGALIAELAERLEDAGATVSIHLGTRPGAHLLHAVLGPVSAPGGVLLAAHGDVVDVEGQPWTSDPFSLRVDGGRLYGRGATDMKGFVAATLAAVADADSSALRAPLHIAISHDEELGCLGLPPLLDALSGEDSGLTALAGVIVGEPTSLKVIDRHKGKLAFDITVHGRPAHSATPSQGVNAVRAVAHLIVALEQLEHELAAESSDEAFGVPYATIGIGPIAGGVALNIVPDHCTLKVEARLLPGQSLDAVTARIKALTERLNAVGVDVERVAGYPPLAPRDADGDTEFAARVAEIAGQGLGGAVDFGTEAGLYAERLRVPVVVCGPGSMAQGHIADEYIETEQLDAAQRFVAGLIGRLSSGR